MSTDTRPICGLVMPISAVDGCSEAHWGEVRSILSEAIEDAGFDAGLVSDADDAGLIHKRIIQNLYENPVVVCDVSGRNANVMFELGIRLAFDKPTIIVKDEVTPYSFDTSLIEHLDYPRDLRFAKIVDFKKRLGEKVRATFEKSTSDAEYTTFLKHFGEFKVAKISKKEVSTQEIIMDELQSIRSTLRRLERPQTLTSTRSMITRPRITDADFDACMGGQSESDIAAAIARLARNSQFRGVLPEDRGPNHTHLLLYVNDPNGIADKDIASILGPNVNVQRVPVSTSARQSLQNRGQSDHQIA